MAITVKHTKVSTIPDGDDSSLIRPSDWNEDHTLTGLGTMAEQDANNVAITGGTISGVSGIGTVTSVAATAGTGISVTGSPITSSGTLNITNTAPDQVVSLTGAGTTSISGTYPNFTITSTGGSGGGDVSGPASATDNAVARYDGTTGKIIQNSATTIDDSGVLATSKGLIGSGANATDYPYAQVVSTQSKISGYGHAYNIGVVGEAQGTSSDTTRWGVGVYGKGWTNGDTRCAGLEGDAGVTSSADTGTATAIRAYSKSTHSGGLNVGITIDVTGSSVNNYALYMQNGNLFSAAAQTWELVDGSNSALRFSTSGKSAILDIITTDGAEGIATSGALGVTGTATLGALGVTGTSSLTNLSVTGTTSFDGSQGTSGQVLTSQGTGNTPTWTTPTTGTVTSVSGTAPIASSGGNTPAISISQATTSTDGYLTSTDWNTFNSKYGSGSSPSFAGITDTGNLTFTGTGNRITGDFSTTTIANRVAFQSSTTNGNTGIAVIPNGSGTVANHTYLNNSDPTNSSSFIVGVRNSGTEAGLNSNIQGTGTYLPMTFLTGGSERLRIDTSGNVGIGTSSPSTILDARGTVRATNGTNYVDLIGSDGSIEITRADGVPFIDFKSDTAEDYDCRVQQVSNGLTFQTGGNGSASERMRITSAGGVSFGSSGTAYGTTGQVLTSQGDASPTWTTPSTGTVTSITAGTGLSGGTITTSGTIAIDSTVATLTGTQTLTNKTLTSPVITTGTTSGKFTFGGAIDETVYAVVDAAGVAISPANGTIQTWTLGASRTPTAGTWDAGESLTMMITDGTAYTITWTTLGVVWVGGTAPTLATTGSTVIELWKVGSTIYGALVGNVA